MDNHIRDVTLKLLLKILNTKRANSVKFIYITNVNLIECGYELKYYLKKKEKYLGKGISK